MVVQSSPLEGRAPEEEAEKRGDAYREAIGQAKAVADELEKFLGRVKVSFRPAGGSPRGMTDEQRRQNERKVSRATWVVEGMVEDLWGEIGGELGRFGEEIVTWKRKIKAGEREQKKIGHAVLQYAREAADQFPSEVWSRVAVLLAGSVGRFEVHPDADYDFLVIYDDSDGGEVGRQASRSAAALAGYLRCKFGSTVGGGQKTEAGTVFRGAIQKSTLEGRLPEFRHGVLKERKIRVQCWSTVFDGSVIYDPGEVIWDLRTSFWRDGPVQRIPGLLRSEDPLAVHTQIDYMLSKDIVPVRTAPLRRIVKSIVLRPVHVWCRSVYARAALDRLRRTSGDGVESSVLCNRCAAPPLELLARTVKLVMQRIEGQVGRGGQLPEFLFRLVRVMLLYMDFWNCFVRAIEGKDDLVEWRESEDSGRVLSVEEVLHMLAWEDRREVIHFMDRLFGAVRDAKALGDRIESVD